MLAESIASLRTLGMYTGDILVFTRDVCPILHALTQPPFNAQMLVKSFESDAMYERVLALRDIHARPYRTVTNLDADILAFRDVSPLFNSSTHIRYMEERWQTIAKVRDQSMYGAAMSAAERLAFSGFFAINVGHFTVPGALVQPFADVFIPEALRLKTFGADQAAFNAIIRRRTFPAKPYDQLDIGNGPMTPEAQWPHYALIHYAGYGTAEQRLQKMRETYARMLAEFERQQPAEPAPLSPPPVTGTSNRKDLQRMESLTPRLKNFR